MVTLLCFSVRHLRRPLRRQQFLVLLSKFCCTLIFQPKFKFQVQFVARSVRPRPSSEIHLKFLRTPCLSLFRVYSRILLHPHRRELSSKFQFEFQVQFVARSVRPRPSSEIHLKFLRTPCLTLFRVYSRTLLHPSSREPSSKFKFLFKFRRTFYLSSSQVCSSIPAC